MTTPARSRLSVTEAAQVLGLSRQRVYALIQSGHLPAAKDDYGVWLDPAAVALRAANPPRSRPQTGGSPTTHGAHSVRIRRAIANLVETRMFDLDVDAVFKLPKPPFDGPICPLVNPLCPQDLCWLPRDHVGTPERYHVLGTTAYDSAERFPKDWLRPKLTTADQLIKAGGDLARQMGFAP